MMGIKPGDCCMVIGIRLMNLLKPGQQKLYSRCMGKVSTLAHCPVKLGCDDYTHLDQNVKDFVSLSHPATFGFWASSLPDNMILR